MARKRAKLTDLLNDLTFKIIYDKYKMIAYNQFKWTGLPSDMMERHIERLLYNLGKACFFKDPETGLFYCLECSEGKGVNIYNEPVNYNVFGYDYQREIPADECVIIENNKLRLATDPFVMFYTNKIAEVERTMDVNVKANKTPVVILCDDKDVLSFKQIFQKVDGNEPAIYADRALNIDGIQALDLKAKFLGNDLMDYKNSVENEFLTFLGVNNNPIDKKERSIVDEINSNNQLIESFCELQFEARKRARDAINTLYPELNVNVERRTNPEGGVGNGMERDAPVQ